MSIQPSQEPPPSQLTDYAAVIAEMRSQMEEQQKTIAELQKKQLA